MYPDQITPSLSPAYDIVTTSVYIDGETKFALNLGQTKAWYDVTMHHFQAWAEKSAIPWRVIKPHLDDTLEKARALWPNALQELPMDTMHQAKLKAHWQQLQIDFRIQTR